jgi:ER lumen protein retaining receptor
VFYADDAPGVSLLTQAFYLLVFLSRYIDLLWFSHHQLVDYWNLVLKIFFITSTSYILFIMTRVYPRTREREKAWKLGMYCLGGSALAAPIVLMVVRHRWSLLISFELPWTFSIILESVCVLPQLLLLRQTSVPTVLSSYYLLTLGSYRAFYIANWIFRFAHDGYYDLRPDFFGVVQTAFYLDFAWVYWTRQRVKLRNGGVVDEDDMGKSWILSRVLGRGGSVDVERGGPHDPSGPTDDDSPHPDSNASRGRWGARGISVSADDGVRDVEAQPAKKKVSDDSRATGEELAGILEDDESEDEDGILPEVTSGSGSAAAATMGVSGGEEWRK